MGERTMFGYTQDGDLVLIPRAYKGGDMEHAKPGDIVSFVPKVNVGGECPEGQKPAKWFAQYSKLIAKKFELAPSATAFAWKRESDSEADSFSSASR